MKVLKFVAVAFVFMAMVSCKNEQKSPEVVEVSHEEVKAPAVAANAKLEKAEFNIEGMTCAVGCAAKIEKSLNNMKGVSNAKVNFETKTAEVEYDVDKVTTDLLAERVAKNGDYKVTNMNAVSAKKCTMKCSEDCTDKDCAKCAAKKEECKKKCAAKKETCEKDCKKVCCAEKA